MITEKLKIADVCDSFLYPRVREKLDAECAAEKNESARQLMEAMADLIGEEVRADAEACRLVLTDGKKLRDVYDAMKKAAFDHMAKTNSRSEGYAMSDREAMRIAGEYYGFSEKAEKGEKAETPRTGVKSIFDLI